MMFKTDSAKSWNDSIREKVIEVSTTYKSDSVLTQMLESLVNSVDSDAAANINFGSRLESLLNLLNKPYYYDRFKEQDEIKAIKGMTIKLNDLLKISNYDLSNEKEDEIIPKGKTRLPNSTKDCTDLYGKSENMRDRL